MVLAEEQDIKLIDPKKQTKHAPAISKRCRNDLKWKTFTFHTYYCHCFSLMAVKQKKRESRTFARSTIRGLRIARLVERATQKPHAEYVYVKR